MVFYVSLLKLVTITHISACGAAASLYCPSHKSNSSPTQEELPFIQGEATLLPSQTAAAHKASIFPPVLIYKKCIHEYLYTLIALFAPHLHRAIALVVI